MAGEFLDGMTLRRGDGATPTEVFTPVPGVIGFPQIGVTNPLIPVTAFGDALEQYIAGKPDGIEVTIEMNRILGNAQQAGMIADVDGGVNRNFEIVETDGTDTNTYTINFTCLSYALSPSTSQQNTITFTLKINGAFTVVAS